MRTTLFASYATHAYISLIGIILMPVYLRYLGAEALGLVGLQVMLQALMSIIDMGLTPALMREISRFRAGSIVAVQAATLLRTLEFIFGIFAVAVFILLWLASDWVGEKWLSAAELPEVVIAHCISLIGLATVVRWFSGLYRATLTGLECQNLLNGISVVLATLRFAGVLPLLMYVSTSLEYFFAFQAGVAVLEFAVLAAVAHRFIPAKNNSRLDWRSLEDMLPLLKGMSILVVIWVAVTQVDKLILSGLLSLSEYGYFTLANAVASGVLILAPPLHQVIQPRLNILVERGEEATLTELYRLASQFAVIAFTGLGGAVAFFAEPLLLIWSGNDEAAHIAAPMLFWYGLANAIAGVLVLPFMLQFARGQLRLHVLGNLILLVTLVPTLVFAARCCGASGAGRVLVVANLLILIFWVPIVHRRFLPALQWRWLSRDIGPIALVMFGVFCVAAWMLPASLDRYQMLIWITVATLLALTMGVGIGEKSRPIVLGYFANKKR